MKIFVLISFSLLFYKSSLSQPDCLQITNVENGEPVSYATIFLKKTGKVFLTDSLGKICWQKQSGINLGDTVLVSAIGYKEMRATISSKPEIGMTKVIPVMPEVVLVKGEGKKELWGTKRNPIPIVGYGGSLAFREVLNSTARIVYPEGEFKKAEIQSVSFYDVTGKDISVPIRIRIFSVGKDTLPAGDYLTDNLIVETKGSGWLEVDLKEKGLLFPKEGLIFGIEFFDDSKENYYQRKIKVESGKSKKMVTMYGFSLAFEKGEKAYTMFKYPGMGYRWHMWRIVNENGLGNLVCRVKVKVWR